MQNYKNHLRLNPAHHFVLIPTTLGLFIWSVVCFFVSDAELEEKLFWFLASFALVLVSMITRVYALKNQDRLIRLEMRQRYFELTGTSFNSKENQLIVFNGLLEHCSVAQTDEKIRVNVNINIEK